jgi:hypothetical protein
MHSHDRVALVEDHRLRSRYVRQLLRANPRCAAPPSTSKPASIPRVLVQFWHDSRRIPRDVRQCLDTWDPLTRQPFDFVRVLFDDTEARKFIARTYSGRHLAAFDRCLHPAMRSDYFRLCYILRRGGFYVDADEVYRGGDCRPWFHDDRLKIQPLCYDLLTGSMIPAGVFTEDRADSSEWIFYVNNNPLIAPASHPVLRSALARSTRLLLDHKEECFDIQAITGPGNLTISLVRHVIACEHAGRVPDFLFLTHWDAMSVSRWPLSYRDDDRNWRLWNPDA